LEESAFPYLERNSRFLDYVAPSFGCRNFARNDKVIVVVLGRIPLLLQPPFHLHPVGEAVDPVVGGNPM
jgi:hypothetical protein